MFRIHVVAELSLRSIEILYVQHMFFSASILPGAEANISHRFRGIGGSKALIEGGPHHSIQRDKFYTLCVISLRVRLACAYSYK